MAFALNAHPLRFRTVGAFAPTPPEAARFGGKCLVALPSPSAAVFAPPTASEAGGVDDRGRRHAPRGRDRGVDALDAGRPLARPEAHVQRRQGRRVGFWDGVLALWVFWSLLDCKAGYPTN